MIVSLEKAYSLFLRKSTDSADCGKLTIDEYVVYSHFMRNGYQIQQTKPETDGSGSHATAKQSKPSTQMEQECVWNYLNELLGQQQHNSNQSSINNETYERIKASMDMTISKFRSQDTPSASGARKRKHEDSSDDEERVRDTSQYFGNEPLHSFMTGDETEKFKEIFDQIDVIQLDASEAGNKDSVGELNFSFDLWTGEGSQPNYRIIVQRYETTYCCHQDNS